mgnify:CR=1 FL=1
MIVTAQVEITYEVPDNLQRENLWKSGLVFIDNEFYKTITKKVIAMNIMPEEKETIFQDAIDTFGEECQIRKAVEELLELAIELSHYADEYREDSPGIEDAIVSEIADVMVITEELKIVFKDQDIEGEYNRKIARLRERIKKRWDND